MFLNIGNHVYNTIPDPFSYAPVGKWPILVGGSLVLVGGLALYHYFWKGDSTKGNLHSHSIAPPPQTVANNPFASLNKYSVEELEKRLKNGIPLFKWAIFTGDIPLFDFLIRKGFKYQITKELKIEFVRFFKQQFGATNPILNNNLTKLENSLISGSEESLIDGASTLNLEIDSLLQGMKMRYDQYITSRVGVNSF